MGTRRTRAWALALTGAGLLMITLDSLVVLSTMPAIQRSLATSLDRLQWVVDGYILSYAVLMLTGAALGDRYGRRRMFVVGVVVFTLASALCAVAGDAGTLIAARVLQGAGAAILMPLTLTLLTDAFPPARRSTALGIWSATAGIGVALGPLVGGAVVDTLSWHWVFWINVPVGIAIAVLAPRRLGESHGPRARLDLAGLALVSLGLLAVVWATSRGNAVGWSAPWTVGLYAAGVALLVAFVGWELRARAPMLPPSLFSIRAFSAANVAGFTLHFAMFAAFFLIVQYLTHVEGAGPLTAGLENLPWTLMPLLVSPLAGAFGPRVGARAVTATGLAVLALGATALAVLTGRGESYPSLIAPLVLAGVGIALVLPTIATVVVGSVPPTSIGKASGANATFRQLGGVFGIAVAVAVFQARGSYESPTAVASGVSAGLWVAALAAAVGAAGALLLPGRAPRRVPEAAIASQLVVDDLAAAAPPAR